MYDMSYKTWTSIQNPDIHRLSRSRSAHVNRGIGQIMPVFCSRFSLFSISILQKSYLMSMQSLLFHQHMRYFCELVLLLYYYNIIFIIICMNITLNLMLQGPVIIVRSCKWKVWTAIPCYRRKKNRRYLFVSQA